MRRSAQRSPQSLPVNTASAELIAPGALLAALHIGFVTEGELDCQFSDFFQQVNAYPDGAAISMINPQVCGP